MLIKRTRIPLSCDTLWSIHPVLDTRTVHIVLCIHHLLLLFNNNTNSLLLRRLLWDWLVASQERWVCTKLPMYVLSTFLLPFYNCCTTLYYRGRVTLGFLSERECRAFGVLCAFKKHCSADFYWLWFFVLHIFQIIWRQWRIMKDYIWIAIIIDFIRLIYPANLVCGNLFNWIYY